MHFIELESVEVPRRLHCKYPTAATTLHSQSYRFNRLDDTPDRRVLSVTRWTLYTGDSVDIIDVTVV